MKIKVCSGFSPKGRISYGNRFLETFDRYWPKEIALEVYVEEPMDMPRGACRLLWDIPGAIEFNAAHKDNPDSCGRIPHRIWKDAERAKGYSFRHDAQKFFKQILIPGAAAEGLNSGDILVWLDADVVTFKPVPADFVPGLLGDADVAYLGRERSHSEIGFWAIRISDKTKAFLAAMAHYYTTGSVFDLPEWHSAYVWDQARAAMQLRERNLCRPGARGHVWPDTKLAAYTVHNKGPRKPQ